MIFNWLDAKAADEFGKKLAQLIVARVPLSPTESTNKVLVRQEAMIDKFHLQVSQFKSQNQLNIYKKARLANAFKSELNNAGYDTEFIDQTTISLLQML